MEDCIIYIEDGIEIIPTWKQCGERQSNWSTDEKWLWDTGEFTQHMLFVAGSPEDDQVDKFIDRVWWVWQKYERGHVVKENFGNYTAHIHIGMTRSEKKGFKTLEAAARRVAVPKHHLEPGQVGLRFVTKKEHEENIKPGDKDDEIIPTMDND